MSQRAAEPGILRPDRARLGLGEAEDAAAAVVVAAEAGCSCGARDLDIVGLAGDGWMERLGYGW